MTELRLEFHLPQFLLPEDWAPEGEEEEGNPTDKLGAPSVSQVCKEHDASWRSCCGTLRAAGL